ncbi:MAG: transglycosylase SLT domain-containing protein [Acidobacteriota bacterium]
MPFETLLALLLVSLAATPEPAPDVRIALVEKQLEGDLDGALALVDASLEVDGERARRRGFNYLRGQLLLEKGRRAEAMEAFAATLDATPALAPWARLRLAEAQADGGDAEVAAGLVATLLGSSPPRSLLAESVALFEETLAAGGDCRLLGGLGRLRLGEDERRLLSLARAHCDLRSQDLESARSRWIALLDEDSSDDVALRAAELFAANGDSETYPGLVALGMGFYDHREFDHSARYLAQAVVQAPSGVRTYDLRYALARSYFWLRRYEAAARAFAGLAAEASEPSRRSQALYQRARSLELAGETRWPEASAAFQATYAAEPRGRFAAAALIARLRLAWLRGDYGAADGALTQLRRQRKWTQVSSALLFLASSEILSGRTEGVGAWLDEARRLRRLPVGEVDYWRGRLAERLGDLDRAVELFAEVARRDPYDAFGRGALARLGREPLREPAARLGRSLAARTDSPTALYKAWLLLGPKDPRGVVAKATLRDRLERDPKSAAYLGLGRTPTAEWPLWRARHETPADKLLGLGLFAEAPNRVLRHFPVAQKSLAFTGSQILSEAGATRRSLYVAEILAKRKPVSLPAELLPAPYRRLLYPFRYSYLILKETRTRGVDSYLLAAIIREESRFDPQAFSGASARGLTQFIVPTARTIAEGVGMESFEPADLHRPEVAIALGASYLEELVALFEGDVPSAVAAYNAGEPQAELWRKYCVSDEVEEYLTKVAFRETRNYVRKVLRSRSHYEALYAADE